MPTWVPLLKAVMPHLVQIVSAAAPAFTAKPGMVAQQISELQEAVRTNADSVRVVAEQVQHLTQAFDELANDNRRAAQRARQAYLLAAVGLTVAVVALGALVWLMALR